jgi:hypothetical protein
LCLRFYINNSFVKLNIEKNFIEKKIKIIIFKITINIKKVNIKKLNIYYNKIRKKIWTILKKV